MNRILEYFVIEKMDRLIVICLCSLFLSLPFIGSAQKILTLEDAIAVALENNYDIRLAKSDSARLGLDYTYRNVVFLPRINATLGNNWTNNNQIQEFSDGTDRQGDVKTGNINAGVTLDWTLFDGMKMFTLKKKAEEYAKLGQLELKNQVINTVAQVIEMYYIIVRQKQQLVAIEEQMSINQTRVDLSKRKLEVGMGTKPEYLQSQIDLNAQKSAKMQQETYIRELKLRLNQLINPTPEGQENQITTNYVVSDSIPINNQLSLEDIQDNLEESNPALQLSRKNLDIAGLSVKEIKADQYPVIEFNSAYNFRRSSNDIALNPFLPLINQNKGVTYGFSATMPILNYRNTNRLIKHAELDLQYQSLSYASERSRLQVNVVNAFNLFQLQLELLALEEANILLARENVDITLETYRLGSTTFIELREAEKSLNDAYDRLINARYNAKLAETELMRLKGELVY
jgi:outer membrane protein